MSMSADPRLVVVDTNVWGHLFLPKRKPVDVTRWRQLLLGHTLVIATQTRAEVLTGFHRSGWGEAKREKALALLDATATVPVTKAVVDCFARLRADCVTAGHGLGDKIHTGDLWIAASAVAIRAPLLSADHIFRRAPGLMLLDTDTSG